MTAPQVLRPTRADIDLSAIAHNFGVVRAATASKVLAVIKADAYGHSVIPVAKTLQQSGVDGFGVALAEEGLELREAGIDRAIVVLNGVYGDAHEAVIAAGLTPVLYNLREAHAFEHVGQGRPIDVHLKIDTGMGRLGVPFSDLEVWLTDLRACPSVRIVGLMTHLATADDDRDFVAEQLKRFDAAHSIVKRYGHVVSVRHAANTAAMFRHPESHYDWVRPGLALFGYGGAAELDPVLKPAMRWRTEVIAVKTINKGHSVGYGRTFIADKPMTIAVLPLGYADGLLRSLSNRGHVLVRGQRCPIVGRVSMDLTTVDVSGVTGVALGDEVMILGEQGEAKQTALDLARDADTIPYEILTNVSRRVPRFMSHPVL